jgi:diguanylate cyclase (GGDEF)-like protein/PAS domain S-box-containing protein
VLLVAPPSACLQALREHIVSLPGSAADRIDDASTLAQALIDGSWDAIVFEHDPAQPDADALLRSVVALSGERPVVVVADEIGARATAAALRAGAADFVLRTDPEDVVAALERCLDEDRRSRREVIEASTVTAVSATEEHFSSAFGEAPIGMAIISIAGIVVRVNRAMCEMSGYSDADLVGKDFHAMVHPEDVMLDHQQGLDLLTGEIASYQVEKRYFHRNGKIRWINQSVSVARDDGGIPVYFIAQMVDTSAAREAEAALRAANARLQAIFDYAPVWLSLRGMDGRYLDANNELAQVLGTTREELLGAYPGDFRQTPRVAQVAEDDRIVWETQEPITHEITIDHPTRGRRDYRVVRYPVLDENGDVDAVGSFALDITDRRDADVERDRALAAFTEAQKIANVGSWTWDAVTDRSEWSDEMKRIFGLELEAAPPDTAAFFTSIDPADRDTVAAAYQQVIANGPMFEVEYRINAGDGAHRVLRGLGRADPERPGAFIGTVQDVTELRAIERDIQAARERFRLAFEDAPVGMAISTIDGHLIQVNNSLCEITGYTRDELLSINIATITHPEELDDRTQLLDQLLSGEIDNYRRDGRLLRANGDAIWVSRHVRVLRDDEGRPAQILTHIVDITERRLMERELRHMADHDPLTGLLNRRGLEAELERHVAHVNRYGPRGALLVLDLDHFKAVNDTLGHEAGDRLIVSVANLLRKRLRSSDAIARLGGDEFAILLPDANSEMAAHVAQEIVSDIQRGALVEHGQTPRHITASIGVTLFAQGAINAESVLVDADLAMYDAKEAGRDQVAIHTGSNDDQPRMKARLEWIERIRSALDHGQFTLYAQPIRELHSDRVEQCELLLRMVDDTGDTIPPGAFLYIAERYDLIHELDEWVAKEAIKLVEREQAEGRFGSVEINVSGKSLANARLLEVVEAEIKRTQIDPSRLIFEVTETAAISHMALAREFAERLKALGCRFALDDFGAGFGGFFYLKHIPFDYLKIDREFVTNCRNNRIDQLVIEALVSLARGLNKQTVAEGVEDHQTELFLRRHGVDLAQGFHIGRPAPIVKGVPLWSTV